jgi:hypothetical protein
MKPFLPSKKISWLILISFFTFDNFVSYWAITQKGGKEANLFIAPIVEKYPLLYFLCIPGTILAVFIIVLLIKKIAVKILKKRKIEETILEKITLTSTVIFWAFGNSLPNLIFILGFRISYQSVWILNNLALLPAICYSIILLTQIISHRHIHTDQSKKITDF